MAAASGQRMDGPGEEGSVNIKDFNTEVVAACLGKMKCLPGSVMDHGPALRGLAAIGRGEVLAAGDDAPSAMSLVELEAALRDAGSALLEQAGLLAGQHERGGVCAALQYLSFRCFCAVDMLHQAASGVSADAVPEGDALWGAIVGAWGSVRSGVNVEGALADLTRWWQGFEEGGVDVAGAGGSVTHDAGGEAAADAALAGMRQQAEWLRGEAAGDLTSESAAKHLECAASVVKELRGLLGCGVGIASRKLVPVSGTDAPEGVVFKNSAEASVCMVESHIAPNPDTTTVDVEEWASVLSVGVGVLRGSVASLERAEGIRVRMGLPRMAQRPHRVAVKHACIDVGADEPVGEQSTIAVQLQCEQGWPLGTFVDDEAWGDVGLEAKQRVAMSVLGVCAVAEACGVSLSGLGVGSFVVVGVGSGSVGDLLGALDGGGCEVLLSACAGVWRSGGRDGAGAGGGSAGVSGVVRSVLGVGWGARGGAGGVEQVFVGSGEVGGQALARALEAVESGGMCWAGAFAIACEDCGVPEERLQRVGSAIGTLLKERQLGVLEQKEQGAGLRPPAEAAKFDSEKTAAFQKACKAGNVELVRELLALSGHHEVDVHAGPEGRPEYGFRAACANGHLGVVQELLALEGHREVDVHAGPEGRPESGFRLACQNGHIEVVRELLALGGHREVDVHVGPEGNPEYGFRLACQNGHIEVVRELLALEGHREVNVHAAFKGVPEYGFRAACANGHLDVVRELLALGGHRKVDVHVGPEGNPEYGFRLACQNGHLDVVRELLALTGARKVNVHAGFGGAPESGFRLACENGHIDVVRELLALGGHREVDVHAGSKGDHEFGFQLACQNGRLDVVRALLALTGHREVDVHAGPAGEPEAGFRLACENGHIDVVRELLALTGDRAVDVHAGPAGEPESGFRLACENGHIDVVRELLALTGDRAVDVHAGFRCVPEAGFRLACQNGHIDVVRVLLALRGDREVNVHAGYGGDPELGFQLACENGHVDVVRELLSLTGARSVDVHAGPEGWPESGFRLACQNGRVNVVRELLVLSGDRRISDSVRQQATKFGDLHDLI